MRKIEVTVQEAFQASKTRTRSKEQVLSRTSQGLVRDRIKEDGYYLFQTRLAFWQQNANGSQDCMIPCNKINDTSQTTKNRLNAILAMFGYRVFQKNYRWFVDDLETGNSFEFPSEEWNISQSRQEADERFESACERFKEESMTALFV